MRYGLFPLGARWVLGVLVGMIFPLLVHAQLASTQQHGAADEPAPAPCIDDTFDAHRRTGAFLQELGGAYKQSNQQDLRTHEQEEELRNGINCLQEQIWELTNATRTNKVISDQRKDAIDKLLGQVSEVLAILTDKVKVRVVAPGPTPPGPRGDDSALLGIMAELKEANQVLGGIREQLKDTSGVSPPITVVSESYATARVPMSKADADPRDQIDPRRAVREYFDGTTDRIELALAAIPDPRVPRHRRQYDNAVTAINQGMLRDGFVLDRFGFPWSKDLQSTFESGVSDSRTAESGSSSSNDKPMVEDDHYGLMIFRRDRWRDKNPNFGREIDVRALYLIPETAAYGLQQAALRSAVAKIDAGVMDAKGAAHVMSEGNESAAAKKRAGAPASPVPVVLFGPMFSGSLDSVRETAVALWSASASAWPHVNSMEAVSTSATVDSNEAVNESRARPQLHYTTSARSDGAKLKFIQRIAGRIGVAPNKVAIVYEATTFGLEACRHVSTGESIPDLCKEATQLPFPVNIADVRFGLRAKTAAHAAQTKNSLPMSFDDTRLSLEDGAENGSEFPESHQSPLTAVSTELELEHLIRVLKSQGSELVVIIATDVRDRLFLIEQISSQLDGALFVDLGADRLLGHPDFIHATRGVLTLSSSSLISPAPKEDCSQFCGALFQVWSTDEQAMLANGIAAWLNTPTKSADGPLNPYVVSRNGLLPNDGLKTSGFTRYAEVIGCIVCSLVFAGWGIGRIVRRRGRRLIQAGRAVTGKGSWHFFLVVFIAAVIGITTSSLAFAVVTGIVGICFVWWSGMLTYSWASAMIWVNTGLLLAIALAELFGGVSWAWFTYGEKDPLVQMQPLLAALSQSASGGLAYPIEQCVAVVAIIITILLSEWIAGSSENCDAAMDCVQPAERWAPVRRAWENAGLIVASLGVAAAIAAPLMFFFFGARQVTVFGEAADFSAFIALVATTLLCFCALVGAVAAAARVNGICDLALEGLRSIHGIDPEAFAGKAVQPLMWTGLSGARPEFLATPVMAHWWSGGALICGLRATPEIWGAGLEELIKTAPVQASGLRALYALLAAEMGAYQFCIAAVACAAMASSLIVYLFPVSQATALIVLNLIVLLIAGAYSAYQTTAFEGNMVLSNVLSNRTQAREWSMPLFLRVMVPFVVLAIVVGIGQIPGVLDVGNGTLEAILKAIKPGG